MKTAVVALVLVLGLVLADETITYTTYTASACGGVGSTTSYTAGTCKNNVLTTGSMKATETLGVITVYSYTQSDCGDTTPSINTYTSGKCQDEKVGTLANSFKWDASSASVLTFGLVQLFAMLALYLF